ncbi:MAG: LytR C-terminal domain-containing protein, partial [Acidimicrobiales bacterium]|nr:LytR C-terminal domain-containing protein [Acidimicrobiales bacterium]
TQDQASEASDVLATAGFSMLPPNSAVAVDQTEVHYAPGHEADAALVARYLYADPVLVLDVDATQVTVITGPDFGAAVLDPRPAADVPIPTTTTTTAPEAVVDPSAPTTTTTTTEPTGYVPQPPPPGESCG